MTASLDVRGASVRYGDVPALEDLSLAVGPGEVMALLGPSGSGKTTLLHAAAGFVTLDAGEVEIAGRIVSRPGHTVPPEQRRIGLVFQSFALWPHMSVLDTVAYPCERRGIARSRARERARELLEYVGLTELAERRPSQLSGGQQQRVGLARALAVEPALFLFDEPTANLDTTLRWALQGEIRAQQRRTAAGALWVTHDPSEAFRVADRLAVLRDGRLIQNGTPAEVYRSPMDRWVARLTGPASILDVSLVGERAVEIGGTVVDCEVRVPSADAPSTGAMQVCLRPEAVRLGAPGQQAIAGHVREISFQGAHTDYVVASGDAVVTVREPGTPRFAAGERVSWTPCSLAVLAGGSAAAQPGKTS